MRTGPCPIPSHRLAPATAYDDVALGRCFPFVIFVRAYSVPSCYRSMGSIIRLVVYVFVFFYSLFPCVSRECFVKNSATTTILILKQQWTTRISATAAEGTRLCLVRRVDATASPTNVYVVFFFFFFVTPYTLRLQST